MSNITKRSFMGRGKGYLNAAGPQSRFIIFLIFVLMAYTLLLRVFQKLAEILQLPVFLPISLITLLVFVGVVGTIYSHSFAGPMGRITRAIDAIARGDFSVPLRLRDSDDPMLKELVAAIERLSLHTRNTNTLIRDSVRDLAARLTALDQAVKRGADAGEIQSQIAVIAKKRELLDQAVQSLGKS